MTLKTNMSNENTTEQDSEANCIALQYNRFGTARKLFFIWAQCIGLRTDWDNLG